MARTRGNTALQLEQGQRIHKPARHITTRESQILKRVARGRTNREIAAALHITERTAKAHLSAIFDFFGVENRTQAVIAGQRAGLL